MLNSSNPAAGPGPTKVEIDSFCSAAANGYVNTLTLLLDAYGSAIIDEHDSVSACALTWASCNGNKDIVEILLQRGAAVDNPGTMGTTALGYAASSCTADNPKNRFDIARLLLEKGAAADSRNALQQTPLDIARNNPPAVAIADLIAEYHERPLRLRREQEEARKEQQEAQVTQAKFDASLDKIHKTRIKIVLVRKSPSPGM